MKGNALNFFIDPYAEVDGRPVTPVQRRLSYTQK